MSSFLFYCILIYFRFSLLFSVNYDFFTLSGFQLTLCLSFNSNFFLVDLIMTNISSFFLGIQYLYISSIILTFPSSISYIIHFSYMFQLSPFHFSVIYNFFISFWFSTSLHFSFYFIFFFVQLLFIIFSMFQLPFFFFTNLNLFIFILYFFL